MWVGPKKPIPVNGWEWPPNNAQCGSNGAPGASGTHNTAPSDPRWRFTVEGAWEGMGKVSEYLTSPQYLSRVWGMAVLNEQKNICPQTFGRKKAYLAAQPQELF